MPAVRRHTFVAHVENRPGVLAAIAGLFRRRAYNIDSLSVGCTDDPGVSRVTIVTEADEVGARLVAANLWKLINVLRVDDVTDHATIVRELALIKVRASVDERAQVLQLLEVFRARVVDIAAGSLVVELTGTEDKLLGLLEVLRPFGIVELVRAGSVAMTRGGSALSACDPTTHPSRAIHGE